MRATTAVEPIPVLAWARRWVVERILAWLRKCRAIPIRYDKNPPINKASSNSPVRCCGTGGYTASTSPTEFSDDL